MPRTLRVQFDRIIRHRWLIAGIVVLSMLVAVVTVPSGVTSYTGRALISSSTISRKPDSDAILAQAYVLYFNDPAFQGAFRSRAQIPSDVDSFNAEFIPGTPLVYIEAVGPNADSSRAAAAKLAQTFVDEVNSPLVQSRQQIVTTMTNSFQSEWGDRRAHDDPDAIKAELQLQQSIDTINSDQSNQLTLMQKDSGVVSVPSSGRITTVGSGAIGGFLLGCVIAMMLGAAARRLYTEDDITDKTGLQTLEVVPAAGRVDRAEQRQVRLRHLANVVAQSEGVRSVAVSPVSVGSVAEDLAQAIAEQRGLQGARTALVRANLRTPELDPGVDRTGVAEFLAGSDDLPFSAAVDESAGDVKVIARGKIAVDPYPLFDRSRFRALIDQIGLDADLVVIESPPLATSAEAQVVSEIADRTLLVIEQGRTRVSEVAEAVRSLKQVGADVLGTVLVEHSAYGWSPRQLIESWRNR